MFDREDELNEKDPNHVCTIRDPALFSEALMKKSKIRFSDGKKYLYVVTADKKQLLIYDLTKANDEKIISEAEENYIIPI